MPPLFQLAQVVDIKIDKTKAGLQSEIKHIDGKIDSVFAAVLDLSRDLRAHKQETKQEFAELKKEISDIKKHLKNYDRRFHLMAKDIADTQLKTDDLEDKVAQLLSTPAA